MAPLYYKEYESDLHIFGLNNERLPKLKEITAQYRKLSLKTHPDKGGKKEDFQKLYEAFHRLSGFVAANKETIFDPEDIEENELRKFFCKYNVIHENNGSTTVFLENGREAEWESVLIACYGEPKITPSGKSWKAKIGSDHLPARNVTITKWDRPKSDNNTKLCVQGSYPHYYLFSALTLPQLYRKVVDMVKLSIISQVKVSDVSKPKIKAVRTTSGNLKSQVK